MRARQHSWQPYIATWLNPGYISWKITWTKLCCCSDCTCFWSTQKHVKRNPRPNTFLGSDPVGERWVWFPLQPRTKDSGALFWSCPSETIRIQRLPGLTKQKAQGLSLRGWIQLCLFSKQRWHYFRALGQVCCLKACAMQTCFRMNLLLPPQYLTPLSHGGTAPLLLLICTLFCHPSR